MSSIDILSASSYPFPEVLGRRSPRRADSGILYGGLTLVQDDGTMNPTDARRQKKASKRNTTKNKTDNNSNDDGILKRKRGRPRVLGKDENAAERRRTQIRLAQRAYRSRKEATITVLSERLAEMDVAIQEMSKSFGSFRDELIGSGLLLQHHKMQQSLQRLVEKSDALVSLSSGSASNSSKSSSATDADAEGLETASASSLPDVIGAAASGDGLLPTAMGDSSDEYNALYASTTTANNNVAFEGEPLLYHNAGMEMISSSSSLPSLSPQNQNHIQPSLPHHLPLPSSYSYQESSFVRRLRRRYAEHGFRMLSDTRMDPRDVSRMFRFSLGFRNCETMLARYCAILSRSNVDDATSGTASYNNGNIAQIAIPPNYHVGNAGTHFPHNRGHSNSSVSTSTAEMYPVSKFIGPWSFHFADLPHNKTSVEELLISNGMGGEWFDPNDVDGYLKEMGILIDAHSTFVAVPSVDTNAHLSDSSSSNSPASSFLPQSSSNQMHIDPFLDSSITASASASANQNENTAMLQFAPYDVDLNMDLDLDLLAPLMSSEKPSQLSVSDYPLNMETTQSFEASFTSANSNTTVQKQNTTRILDVEHFLDRLMKKAVCLGEKSGYRKQDIDDSLRGACYPMF
ncbi:hypothetical protein UA08_06247 [Talaromyces atroroseus]|uniref:BZIP domain-containing protein n=1 Tax=Talaromyces atroroseus TaxID=1441469 RepID=A0A225ABW1_TALAT|nr:hypothetical protein UA08_06247 [Talaromyces atroroseus]OKL58522.1 hypothetical protein UA08_06247 [Talaromyces atroroseus]